MPAKERYALKRPDSGYSQNEEPFNNRVIEVIERSLEYGPNLLNEIQPISFDNDVVVDYHQWDENSDWSKNPDIVIVDSEQAVAYESKRGSRIRIGQLEAEYRQLEEYYDKDDYSVVLLTEDATRPEIIDGCNCEVDWISWYDVARRVNEAELPAGSAYEELRRVLIEVFRLEEMHAQFTGFDDAHPRQIDYFIRDVRHGAPRAGTFDDIEFVDRRPRNLEKSLEKTHRPIGQRYYELALHRPDWVYYPDWSDIESGEYPRSHPCIIIDRGGLESPVQVYAGVSMNPYVRSEIEELLETHREDIATVVEEEELTAIFAENTLTHSDETLNPEFCRPDDIMSWASGRWDNKFELLFDDEVKRYRRAIFCRRMAAPADELVPRTIKAVSELSDLFLDTIPEIRDQ